MGGYRSALPDIWQKPWFERLPYPTKLLFLYLFISTTSNVIGLFQASPRRIAMETDIPLDLLEEGMNELVKAGKVKTYTGDWIWVVNCAKHQVHTRSPQMLVHISGLIERCNNEQARSDFSQHYKTLVELIVKLKKTPSQVHVK